MEPKATYDSGTSSQTKQASTIDIGKALIISSALIAGGLCLQSGIYEYEHVSSEYTKRYNKFTGSVVICKFDSCGKSD